MKLILIAYVLKGYYMNVHVLLTLSNELGKKIKCEAC